MSLDGFDFKFIAPPTQAPGLPFTDEFIGSLLGKEIKGPLYAIGIHGAVSPYHLFAFAPRESAAELAALGSLNLPKVLSGEVAIPPGCAFITPGEMVRFAEPVRDGGVLIGISYDAGVGLTQYEDENDPRWPVGVGILRVWRRDPGSQPSQLTLLRQPGCSYISPLPEAGQSNGGDIPSGISLSGAGVALKVAHLTPQTRTVGIQIVKAAGPARLTSENCEIEVWWRMASGFWCHNPDDDWKAGCRGNATSEHDIELYDVPGMARQVLVRITPGGPINLGCFVNRGEG